MIGYGELEASIAAVYDTRLSIPPWWSAEDRHEFIDEIAGQATGLVMTELDDIVDRIIDQADPTTSSDAIAAAITAEQHALLAEVRTTVLYDLTEAIADKSANLTAEAVFAAFPPPWPAGQAQWRSASLSRSACLSHQGPVPSVSGKLLAACFVSGNGFHEPTSILRRPQ